MRWKRQKPRSRFVGITIFQGSPDTARRKYVEWMGRRPGNPARGRRQQMVIEMQAKDGQWLCFMADRLPSQLGGAIKGARA
eukprot:3385332-Lingulodinium_polyedra.AAC.1